MNRNSYDEDYIEYLYNDTYTFTQMYVRSLFHYICPCFRKRNSELFK
jgi:hypothetical protein